MNQNSTPTPPTPEEISRIMPDAIRRSQELIQIYLSVTERAINLLVLANGSGIIVLFTFLYSDHFKPLHQFYSPLGIFIFGFLTIMLVAGADFFFCKDNLLSFKKNFEGFIIGAISPKELFYPPHNRADCWMTILGLVSLLCFIIATCWSFDLLFFKLKLK